MPLQLRAYRRVLRYYVKLQNSNPSDLIHKMFLVDRYIASKDYPSWAQEV